MGFSPQAIAAFLRENAAAAPASFLVHPSNIPAVRLFLALQTQWRSSALSTMSEARIVKTGLDYAAIQPTARMIGLRRFAGADFGRLRAMEFEALSAWAEERR